MYLWIVPLPGVRLGTRTTRPAGRIVNHLAAFDMRRYLYPAQNPRQGLLLAGVFCVRADNSLRTGQPLHFKILGSLAGFAQASLATGADVQANAYTINDDALLVHIRAKIPIGAALGETNIIPERLGFTTDITFSSHGQLPSIHLLVATTRGSKAGSAGDAQISHYQMCTGAPKDRRTGGNTTQNASTIPGDSPNSATKRYGTLSPIIRAKVHTCPTLHANIVCSEGVPSCRL